MLMNCHSSSLLCCCLQGGETRKDQMGEEHGGDASAGYSEMGHQVPLVTAPPADRGVSFPSTVQLCTLLTGLSGINALLWMVKYVSDPAVLLFFCLHCLANFASLPLPQGGEKGGNARKEQMAEEHGGDASAGYAEMGQKGGQA
jgi:hypothetical protein